MHNYLNTPGSLRRWLVTPLAAAALVGASVVAPAATGLAHADTSVVAAVRYSPAVSVKVWRTASGAPRVKVSSNAGKVRLKITGGGKTRVLTVKTNKTIKLPSFAKKVKLRTVGNKKLKPSPWKSVKVPTTTTPAPPSSGGGGGATASAYELEVFRLTNEARATARKCGSAQRAAVPALTYNNLLGAAARGHSADMAAKNYFDHTSKDGRSPWDRIEATGYKFRSAGENIAAGQQTPAAVVQAWLKSPGHCENIMSGSFTEIGVGYVTGGSYGKYWTQNFARPA